MEENASLRIRFSKTGAIRFISHLDLTRTFLRAFTRAGIPLKVSQGFSPHPKFSFALPLSVGMESLCEIADFTPAENFAMPPEKMCEALQAQMPAGIRILEIAPRGEKSKNIAYASYVMRLSPFPPEEVTAAAAIFDGACTVTKKGKKGVLREVDIKSGIHRVALSESGDGIKIECLLSASGESYLNPALLLQAIKEKSPGYPENPEIEIARTGVYLADESPL